ncbi:MAG TPA: NACHT domain-containing protein [Phytomonospora sp.]
MVAGLDGQIDKAAGTAIGWLSRRATVAHRRRRIRDDVRALADRVVAEQAIADLAGPKAVALSDYLASPDFGQIALHLVVAATQSVKHRTEAAAAVRDEIRHGLRHALALPPAEVFALTDVVCDALTMACHEAIAGMPTLPGDTGMLSAAAHVAAAAARNGELLASLGPLTDVHRAAEKLRASVAGLHRTMRLPHTGENRPVTWDRLYIEPTLRAKAEDDEYPEPVAVGDLLYPGCRTVVLGDPGAGKSTLTAKLAHDVAASPDSPVVPFRLVLRDISESLQRGKLRLVDHLIALARQPYNVDISAEAVEYLLLNGRALVILDGLDELTDVAIRSRVVQLAESFAVLYPSVPIVVTSRRVGYTEAPLSRAMFETLLIEPLSDEDVESYAANWFTLDESHLPGDRDRIREAFLTESVSISDLRRNALLLSLLCAMYSAEQYIPQNRVQVYEKCAVMVFERWDGMRGVGGAPRRFHGRVRGGIQALAWHMFTGEGASELPHREVVALLAAHLRGKGLDEDDARDTAEEFLEFCIGRAWVLEAVGSTSTEQIYGFAHRTFMEYFAAEYLVRHHTTPEEVWTVLRPHIGEGPWTVVAPLAIQLMERNRDGGADAILELCLDDLAGIEDEGAKVVQCAFAARICGEIVASPALIKRLVDEALACSAMRSIAERTAFHQPPANEVDWPLALLLGNSLEGNAAYVRAYVTERALAHVDRGDGLYLWLLGDPGEDFEPHRSLMEALSPTQRASQEAWTRRHPGTRLASMSPAEVLDEFGPAPLYQWLERFSIDEPCVVHLHGKASPTLRKAFMNLPTPWLVGEPWRGEKHKASFAEDMVFYLGYFSDARGARLGSALIYRLPYLELVAEGEWPELVPTGLVVVAELIGLRRRSATRELTPADIARVPRHRIPDDAWEFLLRWAAREFSVLG